jgi:hypothetical protein
MSNQIAAEPTSSGTFGRDVAFLSQYTQTIVLKDRRGRARVAVAPAWQGRVMTSTGQGETGLSLGWINRSLIASGQRLPHFNPVGGEDRLWLGPEGGQFSIYFARNAPFDLDHWYVPEALDARAFDVVERARDHITLKSSFDLTNYSGTRFQVRVERTVRVLEPQAAWKLLSVDPVAKISLVSFESRNTLTNAGRLSWTRESGLLSLWILGMFNPSPESTIVIPIKPGTEAEFGRRVTSDYFGSIPDDRLKVTDRAIFLRADGQLRSKVGISPKRSLKRLGSYDATHHALTIVEFDQPDGVTDYVNSIWKLQTAPFAGDVANAYNDGPPVPGKPPMGPFFELESSSPAAALAPGQSLSHTHRTMHLTGPDAELDRVARAVLGVSVPDINASLAAGPRS